ncbi:MAG TPA: hypothetical protein VJQ54_20560 [Candidatus Sulfotelmatobacter sp.]|nr:hypothetical protein [Candidatus Sulfotelmatobacter sp.]
MQIRRIVTGHDAKGNSIFVSDGAAPRSVSFKHVPGLAAALLWETRSGAAFAPGDDPSLSAVSWVPENGASSFMLVTFPPDSVMMSADFDPAAAGAEYAQLLPGLAEHFEPHNPGMHATDTVDYMVLLEGELHLELDGGVTKKLVPLDLVVQNGTRHAWRNRSNSSATALFVLVGATRS